ncbi:MAG TPA: HEPN domain-containing protein [Candidatus Omnitrophica bacterium]|nr:HEPN domain-containing protein [Candidatus Omnitrophota bacterium]HBG64842.1 HEPN domain-containing protein [Candidatus Omnitrophota bacterium]HCD38440.1 HEPN domain-containing protein [Candidatus Omnitrophota bacterium]
MDKKTLDLLKGYLAKAEEKLRVAKTLLKNEGYDDCVSRAYYCAFHAAQALLLTEGFSANTHQGVLNFFGLNFVKTGRFDRKFGKILSTLKDERENGDYEIYSAIDEEVAKVAVKEAEDFLKEARHYLNKYLKG